MQLRRAESDLRVCEALRHERVCSRLTSFRHKCETTLCALVLQFGRSPWSVPAPVHMAPQIGSGHFAAAVGAHGSDRVAFVLVP